VINLLCTCQKQLEVPDHLANQKIKCKHCGKILKVPAPQRHISDEQKIDTSSPFYIKGSRQCQSCGKSYPPADKVCVKCGIDLDSGATLYASLDPEAAAPPPTKQDVGLVARLLGALGLGKKKAGASPAKKK
jgi:hypothetical protein